MSLLEEVIGAIQPLDVEAMAKARERLDVLTKPRGSLGILEEIAVALAGMTGNPRPTITDQVVIVMAGDHGVVAEGVSAYPQEVTAQMVYNFVRGGAAINVLARQAGARVTVVDIGVAAELEGDGFLPRKVRTGTANMSAGPAMDRAEAIRAVEVGIEVVNEEIRRGASLVATGDMGIGNTTPSSAVLAALSGMPLNRIVGRGTGINDERLSLKKEAIERALRINNPDPRDPLDVLAKVGGLEIAGLTGVILGAAAERVPVVLDGFIAGAAALIAARLSPLARKYMLPSHLSEEPGHRIIYEMLDLSPLLHLKLRLGEGTGAVLAFHLVQAATRILSEMATFAEAGVAEELEG